MTTDAVLEMFGHLSLIVLVGAACFRAGWKSASAYLPAAKAVSEISTVAVAQSNNYSVSLDKIGQELVSLRGAIETSIKVNVDHQRNVEDSLLALFQGLERAGLARPPRATARQVGEAAPDS